jgi:hypothetical protein
MKERKIKKTKENKSKKNFSLFCLEFMDKAYIFSIHWLTKSLFCSFVAGKASDLFQDILPRSCVSSSKYSSDIRLKTNKYLNKTRKQSRDNSTQDLKAIKEIPIIIVNCWEPRKYIGTHVEKPATQRHEKTPDGLVEAKE